MEICKFVFLPCKWIVNYLYRLYKFVMVVENLLAMDPIFFVFEILVLLFLNSIISRQLFINVHYVFEI